MSNEILIIDRIFGNSDEKNDRTSEESIDFSKNSPLDMVTRSLTKPFHVKRVMYWRNSNSDNSLYKIEYYVVFDTEKDALEQSFKLNIP
jgi:hypothetical protein